MDQFLLYSLFGGVFFLMTITTSVQKSKTP